MRAMAADIMQPVWISYPPIEQHSGDSTAEIFITVSITNFPVRNVMERQRWRYKQRQREEEAWREH